jgi:hypothetical protein
LLSRLCALLPDAPSVAEPNLRRGADAAQLVALVQRYLEQLQYNHLPKTFFDLRKDRSVRSIMETAREVIHLALPIRCLEASFVALLLTASIPGLERFPISFKSQSLSKRQRHHPHAQGPQAFVEGTPVGGFVPFAPTMRVKSYRHIVLGVRYRGAFGAIGLSRSELLGGRAITYGCLADLIDSYRAAYRTVGHVLVSFKLGLPFSKDPLGKELPCWRFLSLSLPEKLLVRRVWESSGVYRGTANATDMPAGPTATSLLPHFIARTSDYVSELEAGPSSVLPGAASSFGPYHIAAAIATPSASTPVVATLLSDDSFIAQKDATGGAVSTDALSPHVGGGRETPVDSKPEAKFAAASSAASAASPSATHTTTSLPQPCWTRPFLATPISQIPRLAVPLREFEAVMAPFGEEYTHISGSSIAAAAKPFKTCCTRLGDVAGEVRDALDGSGSGALSARRRGGGGADGASGASAAAEAGLPLYLERPEPRFAVGALPPPRGVITTTDAGLINVQDPAILARIGRMLMTDVFAEQRHVTETETQLTICALALRKKPPPPGGAPTPNGKRGGARGGGGGGQGAAGDGQHSHNAAAAEDSASGTAEESEDEAEGDGPRERGPRAVGGIVDSDDDDESRFRVWCCVRRVSPYALAGGVATSMRAAGRAYGAAAAAPPTGGDTRYPSALRRPSGALPPPGTPVAAGR